MLNRKIFVASNNHRYVCFFNIYFPYRIFPSSSVTGFKPFIPPVLTVLVETSFITNSFRYIQRQQKIAISSRVSFYLYIKKVLGYNRRNTYACFYYKEVAGFKADIVRISIRSVWIESLPRKASAS